MKIRRVILAGVLALSSFCLYSLRQKENAVEAKIASNKGFGTQWEATNDSLQISDVAFGGIGTIRYTTLGSASQEEKITNGVRIPFSGYDLDHNRLSIKYEANFPVTGHNITIFCGMSADIGTGGEDLERDDKLVGWFENWNVTTGQSKDGGHYITLDHYEYTRSRTVDSVVLDFSYVGDESQVKELKLLGLAFHNEEELPVFASDPKEFEISNMASTDAVVKQEKKYTSIEVNGTATVTMDADHYDKELYSLFSVKASASSAIEAELFADDVSLGKFSLDTDIRTAEFDYDKDTVSKLKLVFKGTGTVKLYDIEASTPPQALSWSTSNTDYFDLIEDSDIPGYQKHFIRNEKAGYPKFTISIDHWREEYDMICLDFKIVSGLNLTGVQLSSEHYLRTHWSDSTFLKPGSEYHLTYFNPYDYDPEWKGTSIIMYPNPSSIAVTGYDYRCEFYMGISFMKSSNLPKATISLEKELYEFDYDGQKHTIAPQSYTPEGANLTVSYINSGGKASSSGPSNPGTYTARFVVEGTREYAQAVKEATIVIKALKQDAPTSGYSIDVGTGKLVLESGLEASYETSFESLIANGEEVAPGTTIYIRTASKAGYDPSDPVTFVVPNQNTNIVNLQLVQVKKTSIEVDGGAGVEYRICTGSNVGEWKDSGKFIGLKADTLYRVEARYKATDDTMAGEITTLPIRTKLSNDDPDPVISTSDSAEPSVEPSGEPSTQPSETPSTDTKSEEPEEDNKEEKKGCGGGLATTGLISLVGLAGLLLIKKFKEKD